MSKIKKVILYKHGVGYFERGATVEGDTELKLGFRAEEMNDVLKSLTVFDNGGGTINSISYDNQKPVSKLLEEISLDLPSHGGTASLLATVRGARVEAMSSGRKVRGQVVGLEERATVVDGAVSQEKILSLLDSEGTLHNFNLKDIMTIRFLDEHLKSDLQFLFETLLSATKSDTKNLKLFARGNGERELSISYVVECPVWKTSYRIALSKEDDAAPYLQGWALIDNPQDEDWSDVELSLVSGLPISFRHDLYSPRYLSRTEIEVEREAAAAPVMAEGVLDCMEDAPVAMAASFGGAIGGGGPPMPKPAAAPAPMRARKQKKMAASQKVETITQKVGQLFEYKIDHPVTVLRNQSALVPIVGDEFEGKRKLLYNEQTRAENPFAVLDFKNTTGLTLEGGPLTVFEGDVYAGEAMMDTLAPDEERLLPYSVELGVTTKVEHSRNEVLLGLKISEGVWHEQNARYQETKYRFTHKSMKKELLLEHPLSDGELVKTPKPVSETRSLWRFSVSLENGPQTEFTVTERFDITNTFRLSQLAPLQIVGHFRGKKAKKAVQEILEQLESKVQEISKLERQQKILGRETDKIGQTQRRLRENLKSLGSNDDEKILRTRYVQQLTAQEDRLQEIATETMEVTKQEESVRKEFYAKLNSISLEELYE